MPAPVPNRNHRRPAPSRSAQNVRIPTASSASSLSASTQPMAPQYGPRGEVSRSVIAVRALDFGAPETDPGGYVAANTSRHVAPSRSRPLTVETRWTSPGWSSKAQSASTDTVPGQHTPDRSLRMRSTIMMFSAWSFGSICSRVAAVPLIGLVTSRSPRRDRKSSGDALTTSTPALTHLTRAACGAGFPSRRSTSSPSRSAASSIGWLSTRQTLTW